MDIPNEQAFLSAAFPERFRILGCELEPFAIGHFMLLARLGNRFVVGTDPPNAKDLFQALFVCSRPYSRAIQSLECSRFKRWMWRISATLWIRKTMVRLWLLSPAAVSIPNMIGAFADYILAHAKRPELSPADETDAKPEPGTPFIQFIFVTLVSRLHYPAPQALDLAYGEALYHVAAYWEMEGRLRLISDQDRATFDEHVKLLKELDSKLEEIERGLGHGDV